MVLNITLNAFLAFVDLKREFFEYMNTRQNKTNRALERAKMF